MQDNQSEDQQKRKSGGGKQPGFQIAAGHIGTPPTREGLTVAPKSPAKAKNANIAVPPLGHFCDEMLIVPGHIIPTETPQSAQPAKPIIGIADKDAVK